MELKIQDLKRMGNQMDTAAEALKKKNKRRRDKLTAFRRKYQEICKTIEERNLAYLEENVKLWNKTKKFLENVKKRLEEEPDLWKEDLDAWQGKMELWKEELDLWEKRQVLKLPLQHKIVYEAGQVMMH